MIIISLFFFKKVIYKPKMSDLAAAQREARRRKITQNAQARMNKLLGRPDLDSKDPNHQEANSVLSHNSLPATSSSPREEENQPQPQFQPFSTATSAPKVEDDRSQPQLPNPPQSSPYNLRRRPRRSESPYAPAFTEENVSQRVVISDSGPSTSAKASEAQAEERNILPAASSFVTERPVADEQRETQVVQGEQPETRDVARAVDKAQSSFDAKAVDLLRIIVCVTTSFIVRSVLRFGFGLFMVESIFLPFIVTEGFFTYIVETYLKDVSPVQSQGTLVSAALMLCGIKPELMGVYHKIMSHVAMVASDFSVYFFTFILWNAVMS